MANELGALAEVAADAVDRLGITPVQTLHAAIAERVFTATGAPSAPTRAIHDGIAGAAYTLLRRATSGAAALAGTTLRERSTADARPISRSAGGRMAIAALNALTGDRLAQQGSDLAIGMAVRRAGHDLPLTPAALRRAFPRATGEVVVFLHGLAETEEWWLRSREASRPFGARLRDDQGLTPVYLRYNTGLHVSENGATLDALLERLTGAWPVPIDRLVLVGHSMGGLVIRSACHAATEHQHTWQTRVRNVVTLGTPHHGAPLAKAVHVAAWALRAIPEGHALAGILDMRSAGIRDLRFGALHPDDWRDDDPYALGADTRRTIPLLDDCRHTFITATVTRDPQHPLGWLAGDLLVRTESARGRCRERTIPVDDDCVVHVGSLTHFDLLDHPLVYDALRSALRQPSAPATSPLR